MSQRYEVGAAADTACEVVAPNNPLHTIWDDNEPLPASGMRALVIGNPWASAYAVLGTIGELERFVTRQMANLHRARGGDLDQDAAAAVTYDEALLADWLTTHTDAYNLTGHYTPQDNIATRLAYLLHELRSRPRIWHTTPDIEQITVYPTTTTEAGQAELGAVLTIDMPPVRLASDHLTGRDLTGLCSDSDQLPWPLAAQRAITAAAEAVNDLVARWRAATAAHAAGQPTP